MNYTKTEILEAYDAGVRRAKYPLRNERRDNLGGYCALGVLDLSGVGLVSALDGLRSELPLYLRGLFVYDGGFIYHIGTLAGTLASVFNATKSFAEARAWLDKELTRLVDEGSLSP